MPDTTDLEQRLRDYAGLCREKPCSACDLVNEAADALASAREPREITAETRDRIIRAIDEFVGIVPPDAVADTIIGILGASVKLEPREITPEMVIAAIKRTLEDGTIELPIKEILEAAEFARVESAESDEVQHG